MKFIIMLTHSFTVIIFTTIILLYNIIFFITLYWIYFFRRPISTLKTASAHAVWEVVRDYRVLDRDLSDFFFLAKTII